MRIPLSHQNAPRLYGPEFSASPADAYRSMRQRYGPVAPVLLEGDVPVWIVLSYREAHYIGSNPQIFARDSRRWNLYEDLPEDWPMRAWVAWTPTVLHTEGAEHKRRAGALSDALEEISPGDLARLTERSADELIDSFAGAGRADLVAEYAMQVTARALVRLCGIGESEVATLAADIERSALDTSDAMDAAMRVAGQLAGLVGERRSRPGAGLIKSLIEHPAALDDGEIVGDVQLLISAGLTGTCSWIGNALRLMLVDDQFSLTLQGGRASVDQALNEVLWMDTPVQNLFGRWTTQPVEIGEQRLDKGDMLILGLAAVNADPLVRPDAFANVRANRAHMSFAHGEHSCPVPAPDLAEIIAKTAVEVLLDRLPDAELAVPADDLVWRDSLWTRGLAALPVEFTPTTPVGQKAGISAAR